MGGGGIQATGAAVTLDGLSLLDNQAQVGGGLNLVELRQRVRHQLPAGQQRRRVLGRRRAGRDLDRRAADQPHRRRQHRPSPAARASTSRPATGTVANTIMAFNTGARVVRQRPAGPGLDPDRSPATTPSATPPPTTAAWPTRPAPTATSRPTRCSATSAAGNYSIAPTSPAAPPAEPLRPDGRLRRRLRRRPRSRTTRPSCRSRSASSRTSPTPSTPAPPSASRCRPPAAPPSPCTTSPAAS